MRSMLLRARHFESVPALPVPDAITAIMVALLPTVIPNRSRRLADFQPIQIAAAMTAATMIHIDV